MRKDEDRKERVREPASGARGSIVRDFDGEKVSRVQNLEKTLREEIANSDTIWFWVAFSFFFMSALAIILIFLS